MTTENYGSVLNLAELGCEDLGKVGGGDSPRRTSLSHCFTGREDDGTNPATRSDQSARQLAEGNPVFGVDRAEEGVIEQQVVRFIVVKGESVFSDKPTTQGAESTADQGLQSGRVIDRGDCPTRLGECFSVVPETAPGNQGSPAACFPSKHGIFGQPRHELGVRTSQIPRRPTKGVANGPIAAAQPSPSAHRISVGQRAADE